MQNLTRGLTSDGEKFDLLKSKENQPKMNEIKYDK